MLSYFDCQNLAKLSCEFGCLTVQAIVVNISVNH